MLLSVLIPTTPFTNWYWRIRVVCLLVFRGPALPFAHLPVVSASQVASDSASFYFRTFLISKSPLKRKLSVTDASFTPIITTTFSRNLTLAYGFLSHSFSHARWRWYLQCFFFACVFEMLLWLPFWSFWLKKRPVTNKPWGYPSRTLATARFLS